MVSLQTVLWLLDSPLLITVMTEQMNTTPTKKMTWESNSIWSTFKQNGRIKLLDPSNCSHRMNSKSINPLMSPRLVARELSWKAPTRINNSLSWSVSMKSEKPAHLVERDQA